MVSFITTAAYVDVTDFAPYLGEALTDLSSMSEVFRLVASSDTKMDAQLAFFRFDRTVWGSVTSSVGSLHSITLIVRVTLSRMLDGS